MSGGITKLAQIGLIWLSAACGSCLHHADKRQLSGFREVDPEPMPWSEVVASSRSTVFLLQFDKSYDSVIQDFLWRTQISNVVRSVWRLDAQREFAVIFPGTSQFTSGNGVVAEQPPQVLPGRPFGELEVKPQEGDSATLADASDDAKYEMVRQVKDFSPPEIVNTAPAVRAALGLLNKAPRNGRLLIILTDGDFADNQQTVKALRECNREVRARVCIYYVCSRMSFDPATSNWFRALAAEAGGEYQELRWP